MPIAAPAAGEWDAMAREEALLEFPGSVLCVTHERFFLDHVEGRPVTLMVVGDPRRVNVKKLGKYGKVVRLKQRALFAR